MRYILVFLLLANLGYFAWNYYQEPVVVVEAEPRPLLNTGLTLLEEYDAQLAIQQQEDNKLCSVVSGFANSDEAGSFIEDARAQGLATYLNFVDPEELLQYRVYLAPTPSREIANLTLEDLSERLVEADLDIEIYLITSGELENAVALGVYDSATRAIEVQDQISALGYGPEIEQIGEIQGEIQVWVRPAETDRLNMPEWLDLTGERANLTRVENTCQTIAQASQFQ